MMPFLPIVRVPDADAAIAGGAQGRARIPAHRADPFAQRRKRDQDGARAQYDAVRSERALLAALGSGGPGYLSFSIATPTGEGVTTPLTFTRERQIAIGGALPDHLSMFLARIDGTVTATAKHETLQGCRFLIAQRLETDGSASGDPW